MLLFTWKASDVHTAQVAQGVLIVGSVVSNKAIVFTGEVIKAAVDWRHSRQVIQRFLNFFNFFLQVEKTGKAISGWITAFKPNLKLLHLGGFLLSTNTLFTDVDQVNTPFYHRLYKKDGRWCESAPHLCSS